MRNAADRFECVCTAGQCSTQIMIRHRGYLGISWVYCIKKRLHRATVDDAPCHVLHDHRHSPIRGSPSTAPANTKGIAETPRPARATRDKLWPRQELVCLKRFRMFSLTLHSADHESTKLGKRHPRSSCCLLFVEKTCSFGCVTRRGPI